MTTESVAHCPVCGTPFLPVGGKLDRSLVLCATCGDLYRLDESTGAVGEKVEKA